MPIPNNAAPSRRQSSNFRPASAMNYVGGGGGGGDDLAQSLRQLSLSSASARSPSVASTTRRGSYTPRSPLLGASGTESGRRRESSSRAGTPNLLRRASAQSLHSMSGNSRSVSPSKPLSRRTSANNLRKMSSPPRPPPPTAADIARAHFTAELQRHATMDSPSAQSAQSAQSPQTVVVLQDACYGHRFARPRTSRANLGTIVERPERIQACAVGVAAAYVRLGGRHADGDYDGGGGDDDLPSLYGGRYMPHPQLDALSTDHVPDSAMPFRIHTTARLVSLLSAAVTNVHGVRWMEELKVLCEGAEAKLVTTGKELQRPVDFDRGHGGGDNQGTPPPRLHEGDLYLCDESLDALQGALGGVCEAVDAVVGADSRHRRAFVAIRPPGHHCSTDWPSGFCWINNVHVGIMHGMLAHGLTHAAIVDFDLHHGDGSQAIAWQHNARSASAPKNAAAWKKTSIGYFSLHDINSFPCEAGDDDKVKNASLCVEGAHGQTVWNVHLEPWTSEAGFWALYEQKYIALLAKVRTFLQSQAAQRGDRAKGAIFVSAGFDASEWESAGMQRHKVNVPTSFYARFTRDVVQIADDECAGRVISVLEGGYSDRALISGVLSHVSGLAGGEPGGGGGGGDIVFRSGLGYEMSGLAESVSANDDEPTAAPYNPAWWTPAALDRIDAMLAPPPPPPSETKAERAPHPATTYSSPTAASQAKTVRTTPKPRRSMSSLSGVYASLSPASRPPSPPPPPPPEVPWTVAMHELSKLLIPTGRSTRSCTVEDLAAEASRLRREHQVLVGGISSVDVASVRSAPATPTAPKRVSQRERKPVKPFGSTVIKEEEADRATRRKTVGPTSSVAATTMPARGRPKQTRRLSSASAMCDGGGGQPMAFAAPSQASRPSSGGSSSMGRSTRPQSAMSAATGATTSGSVGSGTPVLPPAARQPKPAAAAAAAAAAPRKKAQVQAAPAARPVPAAKPHVATPAPTSKFVRKVSSSAGGRGGSANASGSANAGASATTDMDTLATGVRKIKINVVTTAQKAAREQARKEAEAKAEAEKQAQLQQEQEKQQQAATPLSAPTLFLTEPEPEPVPQSAGAAPTAFVPYTAQGFTPPQRPTTAPTPAKITKADLPVFTATSTIPFAPGQRPSSRQ